MEKKKRTRTGTVTGTSGDWGRTAKNDLEPFRSFYLDKTNTSLVTIS